MQKSKNDGGMLATFRQKYGWVPFNYLESVYKEHHFAHLLFLSPNHYYNAWHTIIFPFASLEYEKFGLGYASDTTSTRLPTLRVRYACPNNSTCWPRFTIFSTVWRRSPSCLGKTRTTSQCILIPPESICYSLGWLSLLWGNSSFRWWCDSKMMQWIQYLEHYILSRSKLVWWETRLKNIMSTSLISMNNLTLPHANLF